MQVCEGCTSLRPEQWFPSLMLAIPAWYLFNPEFSWFHSFQIKKSRKQINLLCSIMLQKGQAIPYILSLANQWQPHHVAVFTSRVAMCWWALRLVQHNRLSTWRISPPWPREIAIWRTPMMTCGWCSWERGAAGPWRSSNREPPEI